MKIIGVLMSRDFNDTPRTYDPRGRNRSGMLEYWNNEMLGKIFYTLFQSSIIPRLHVSGNVRLADALAFDRNPRLILDRCGIPTARIVKKGNKQNGQK